MRNRKKKALEKERNIRTSKKIIEKVASDWNAYKSGILISVVIVALLSLFGRGICPLYYLLGLPCPGCGMTRSVFELLKGNWQQSWQMHPFGVVWLLYGAAVVVERYVLQRDRNWKKVLLVLVLMGMLLLYIYRMVTMFPDTEPFDYREGNCMEKIIPNYGKWFHTIA